MRASRAAVWWSRWRSGLSFVAVRDMGSGMVGVAGVGLGMKVVVVVAGISAGWVGVVVMVKPAGMSGVIGEWKARRGGLCWMLLGRGRAKKGVWSPLRVRFRRPRGIVLGSAAEVGL